MAIPAAIPQPDLDAPVARTAEGLPTLVLPSVAPAVSAGGVALPSAITPETIPAIPVPGA